MPPPPRSVQGRVAMCATVAAAVTSLVAVASWGCEAAVPPPPQVHPIQREMLPVVDEMIGHAFGGYMDHAFPMDELCAVTGTGRNVLGGLALTLIDALDTLALTSRHHEFRRYAAWVEEHIDFDVDVTLSVFEVGIRYLGGLLGAHFMYEEGVVAVDRAVHDYDGGLLRLAVDLADRLLPAFDTPTGIPYGAINLRHGVAHGEVQETCNACSGTFLLEMAVLTAVTGDPRYLDSARAASAKVFERRDRHTGLMGNHVNLTTGRWTLQGSSVGTSTDSTMEYWIKAHAMTGDAGDWARFDAYNDAVLRFLRVGPWYVEVGRSSGVRVTVTHNSLASFYPGSLVLGGALHAAAESNMAVHALFKRFGALPEGFHLIGNGPITGQLGYPLRPEHIESIYFLYRATHDDVYLEMGREIVKALNARTRTRFGFAGLESVVLPHASSSLKDSMESFMLSETLKYLYLLFDEGSVIHHSHDDESGHGRTPRPWRTGWLFSTEAHPIPNTLEWWWEKPPEEQPDDWRAPRVPANADDEPSPVAPLADLKRRDYGLLRGTGVTPSPDDADSDKAALAMVNSMLGTTSDKKAWRDGDQLVHSRARSLRYGCNNHPVADVDLLSRCVLQFTVDAQQ